MATIITNKFRINNAEQFVESFSESAATTYYLFTKFVFDVSDRC